MTGPLMARARTLVRVPPDEAFAVFTEEIDAWWRHGARFRPAIGGERGVLGFEPAADGGRLLERYPDGTHFELGRVRAWEPGRRLAFGMRGRDFEAEEFTHVEVRFEATPSGTLVTIENTGFEALGAGHPVRHGQDEEAFLGSMGLWWGDVLVAFRSATHRSDQ